MSIAKTLGPILAKPFDIGKSRRKFMGELFSVVLGNQGREHHEQEANTVTL